MSNNIIYINGIFSKEKDAAISPLNRGIMYGDGIFETFRGYEGKVFAIDEHFERLNSSATFLKINVPFSCAELKEIMYSLIEKNALLNKDSRIRLTLTRGKGGKGLIPSPGAESEVIITVEEVAPGIGRMQQEGVGVVIIEGIKIDAKSPLSCHKTLNYIPGILALMEVTEKGQDEGIYLNYDGEVVEGVTSNIFILKNGKLQTPPLSSGLLPGITRDTVIKCAPSCGMDVEEGLITREDLLDAEEAFITSSVREVVPVVRLEDKLLEVGPATKRIQAAYKEFVKKSLG